MRNISELRDIELYKLINYSIKNMIHMGFIEDDSNIIEEDFSLINLDDYFDVDSLRDGEKYQEMLKLAARMGYEKPHLQQEWKDCIVIYLLLLEELRRRKIHINDRGVCIDNKMKKLSLSLPKTIGEIEPTYDSSDLGSDEIASFDYPVRKACWILYRKGYKTYMSSANSMDVSSRKGQIIKNKNVAYILIDPENLSDELKEKLFLDGDNIHWGVPHEHADNGNYYGIWAEITSEEMNCEELSELLAKEALKLPDLTDKKNSRKH